MTRKLITAIVGAALVFAVPAFGDSWGADRQDEAVPVSPGLVDLIAKNGVVDSSVVDELNQSSTLDGLGRAGLRRNGFDKAVEAKLALESKVSTYAACAGRGACAPRNVFERAAAPAGTAHVATVSSGSGIEWPQIGVGFVVGILLALGLVLGLRHTRVRPLAH